MVYKGQRLVLLSALEASDEKYVSAYIKEKTSTPDKTESTITAVRKGQLAVGKKRNLKPET